MKKKLIYLGLICNLSNSVLAADRNPASHDYVNYKVNTAKTTLQTQINTDSTSITALQTQVNTQATNITNLQTQTTNTQTDINNIVKPTANAIGDTKYGGKIFWLDPFNNQHGLIASVSDASAATTWRNTLDHVINATSDGIHGGIFNTGLIVMLQFTDAASTDYAAAVCQLYFYSDGSNNIADWYLPSKYELNLMYTNKSAIGGFSDSYYWSSTETGSTEAAGQDFTDGTQSDTLLKSLSYPVRCIRRF